MKNNNSMKKEKESNLYTNKNCNLLVQQNNSIREMDCKTIDYHLIAKRFSFTEPSPTVNIDLKEEPSNNENMDFFSNKILIINEFMKDDYELLLQNPDNQCSRKYYNLINKAKIMERARYLSNDQFIIEFEEANINALETVNTCRERSK